jgi:hypothetical protein
MSTNVSSFIVKDIYQSTVHNGEKQGTAYMPSDNNSNE